MPENNKTEEFLQKLAPCIERGDLDACVEEAARVAREMGVGAGELMELSAEEGRNGRYDFAYVSAVAAVQGLEREKKAISYYIAGLAAQNLRKVEKAEEHYLQAIAANPNYEEVHSNYAILLKELNRKKEAEEQYKLAINANLKYAKAHSNYANLLSELNRKTEAEQQYKLAISANPNLAGAHSNYANLLSELNRKTEAEKHYIQAIAANPNLAEAHCNYSFLLIELNKRKDAQREIEKSLNFFKKSGQFTISHLVRAWFYERYSEKNFHRKKYRESGEDAKKAGDEYLNASETTEDDIKDNLAMQGNVLKAKSFVRKIPVKSLYKKIINKFGKNPDISELMDNLGEAAKYYEKASCCSAGERKDICNACFSSISVFSEILHAMSALIKDDDPEIDKDKWLSSLEQAHKIYTDKKLNNGVALVDTLKQLIKCVDELAEHRKMGLHIQEERLGKCYNNLLEVSEKLDGALKIIAEHSVEAIRDYAKKQGMGFVKEENPIISLWDNPSIKALLSILTIIAAIIAVLQFIKHDTQALEYLKSVFFNSSTP